MHYKNNRGKLFSVLTGHKTRDNIHKKRLGRFRLDIRKNRCKVVSCSTQRGDNLSSQRFSRLSRKSHCWTTSVSYNPALSRSLDIQAPEVPTNNPTHHSQLSHRGNFATLRTKNESFNMQLRDRFSTYQGLFCTI